MGGKMKAVLFGKTGGLDNCEVRASLLRIPEVLTRVKKAQKVIDQTDCCQVDLINHLLSEDIDYHQQPELKELLASVVHLGLYDRFLAKGGTPRFFVAPSYSASPVYPCIGKTTFQGMIVESCYVRKKLMEQASGAIMVNGQPDKYEKYVSYSYEEKSDELLVDQVLKPSESLTHILSTLVEKHGVTQFINIGPKEPLIRSIQTMEMSQDIHVLDSIEMDPMLSWFWSELKYIRECIA